MRGFLHQLATRSLGLAPQIKSRAALPYAAPMADSSMAEAASHEAQPATVAFERPEFEPAHTARQREHATDSALPAPIVAENSAHTTRVEIQTSTPNTSQPRRIADEPSPINDRLDIAPNRLSTPPASDPIASRLTTEPKPIPRNLAPARETRHPAENPQPVLTDLESLVTRLLGNDQSTSEKAPETATPPAVVAPHRASQPPAEISTIRPTASRERQSPAPETDSAPEVHITIGRLEVNPPNRPAPAAQPPRPRGPAPLSLSDYLARRNGGRS